MRFKWTTLGLAVEATTPIRWLDVRLGASYTKPQATLGQGTVYRTSVQSLTLDAVVRGPKVLEARPYALVGAGLSFSNAPGHTFEYSNLGYILLGKVVSKVSGMRFQEFVTREVLREAGEAIVEIVRKGFEVESKRDLSPVTEAVPGPPHVFQLERRHLRYGQFQRAGFDPQRIYECHGSIHHLHST